MTGKVYLIGAGCGKYDLITLRGKRLLSECDTIIYDALTDLRLLDFCRDTAERIYVGKRGGKESTPQEYINKLIAEKALEGKCVARLKGGDPFVFGRGGEEILYLKSRNIPYDVIPGISSCIAVPETAGIPVTHRALSRSFHVITGGTADGVLSEAIKYAAVCSGTSVFLMGLKNIEKLTSELIKYGRNPNEYAAVISDGATPKQSIVRGTLSDISEKVRLNNLKAPAVIVIGDTVSFDFAPTIHLPLENISVTVCGTHDTTERFKNELERYGADVYKIESIKIQTFDEFENNKLTHALNELDKYTCAAFTSANGIKIFFDALLNADKDIRCLAHLKFAVVGGATKAELRKHGFIADYMPTEYSAAAMANLIKDKLTGNDKLIVLRSESGTVELNDILDKSGIMYDDVKIYRCIENIKSKICVDTDYLIFTSASAADAFFAGGGTTAKQTKIICGKKTAKAVGECIAVENLVPLSAAEYILKKGEENEKIQKTKE